jgi:hypothetical protein
MEAPIRRRGLKNSDGLATGLFPVVHAQQASLPSAQPRSTPFFTISDSVGWLEVAMLRRARSKTAICPPSGGHSIQSLILHALISGTRPLPIPALPTSSNISRQRSLKLPILTRNLAFSKT